MYKDIVLEFYAEPHRHYHTIEHIEYMLDVAANYSIELSEEQKAAIYFHDAIYIPGFDKNELASAALADLYLSNTFNSSFITTVKRIIDDTYDHVASIKESRVVIDLDLYWLSADYETYLANVRKLRKEYSFLDKKSWIKGRKAFLLRFLRSSPNVYHSIIFKDRESKLAENLEKEYKYLESLK